MSRGRTTKTTAAFQTIPQSPAPTQPAQVQEEVVLSGLYLFGTVIDRTRRTIPTKNNTTAEIVTYTILDTSGRRYYVDEYSPEKYFELSEYAEVPVYVKTFKKRTGDIGYSFCVQTPNGLSRGEHF